MVTLFYNDEQYFDNARHSLLDAIKYVCSCFNPLTDTSASKTPTGKSTGTRARVSDGLTPRALMKMCNVVEIAAFLRSRLLASSSPVVQTGILGGLAVLISLSDESECESMALISLLSTLGQRCQRPYQLLAMTTVYKDLSYKMYEKFKNEPISDISSLLPLDALFAEIYFLYVALYSTPTSKPILPWQDSESQNCPTDKSNKIKHKSNKIKHDFGQYSSFQVPSQFIYWQSPIVDASWQHQEICFVRGIQFAVEALDRLMECYEFIALRYPNTKAAAPILSLAHGLLITRPRVYDTSPALKRRVVSRSTSSVLTQC